MQKCICGRVTYRRKFYLMLMPSVLFFGSGHLRGSWFLRVPKKPAILVERRSTAVPFGDAPRARGAAISTRRRPGRNFVVADWTDSMNYGVTLWRVAVVACLPRPGLSFLACPSVLRACPAAGSLCSRSSGDAIAICSRSNASILCLILRLEGPPQVARKKW